MPNWAVYGAVMLAILSASCALAYVFTQSLLAWRALKRLRRHASKELERVSSLADTAAEKAQYADAAGLQESLGRLQLSLARFAVLQAAVEEVSETVDRVTAFYPRK